MDRDRFSTNWKRLDAKGFFQQKIKKKGAAGVGTIQPFKGRDLKFFNSNITTDDAPFLSSSFIPREKILYIFVHANGDMKLFEELRTNIMFIPDAYYIVQSEYYVVKKKKEDCSKKL